MWPGIKNSLRIKIHQNCNVQSKASWLSRQVNEKEELHSAGAFSSKSLSWYKISSLSWKLHFQQNIPKTFRQHVSNEGSQHRDPSGSGQSQRLQPGDQLDPHESVKCNVPQIHTTPCQCMHSSHFAALPAGQLDVQKSQQILLPRCVSFGKQCGRKNPHGSFQHGGMLTTASQSFLRNSSFLWILLIQALLLLHPPPSRGAHLQLNKTQELFLSCCCPSFPCEEIRQLACEAATPSSTASGRQSPLDMGNAPVQTSAAFAK